ncbi:MAG: (5-formylfuran-3-yl)methyl phosphate synthase [Burkholderiaceae bacterium]|nr:(5-formylfuran-3-yl)methyl phosphate synthase [Burkholderiaceae bacterium]
MIRLLVSVRSGAEALVAARGGADFIDAKEPSRGALGDLPPATIREIVERLRDAGLQQPVSATIGDVPMHARAQIIERVEALGQCGVDYVKVGIISDSDAPDVLDVLAHCGTPVVPVFIADRGLDRALVAQALGSGFAGVMADTADKRAGSLFESVSRVALAQFVAQARAARVMVGLAGALRVEHASALAALAPDFAGFRSAVCAGDRSAALDAVRLRALAGAMRVAQASYGRPKRPDPPRGDASAASQGLVS